MDYFRTMRRSAALLFLVAMFLAACGSSDGPSEEVLAIPEEEVLLCGQGPEADAIGPSYNPDSSCLGTPGLVPEGAVEFFVDEELDTGSPYVVTKFRVPNLSFDDTVAWYEAKMPSGENFRSAKWCDDLDRPLNPELAVEASAAGPVAAKHWTTPEGQLGISVIDSDPVQILVEWADEYECSVAST